MSAREPQQIADEILRVWGKPSDDAYVIVARDKGASDASRLGGDGEGEPACDVEIATTLEVGTVITIEKWLP